MKVTQKYLLTEITNYIKLPANAEIVGVDYRAKRICIWVKYTPTKKEKLRVFRIRDIDKKSPNDILLGSAKTPQKEWFVYEQPNEL